MWAGFKKQDEKAAAHMRLATLRSIDKASGFWSQPGEEEIAVGDVGFKDPPATGRPKLFIAKDRGAGEAKTIPLDKVVAQQPSVLRSKVETAIERGDRGGHPDVHAAPDGHYYVEDGHHRLAAAMLRGQKTTTAMVYTWKNTSEGLSQKAP